MVINDQFHRSCLARARQGVVDSQASIERNLVNRRQWPDMDFQKYIFQREMELLRWQELVATWLDVIRKEKAA